LPSSSHRLGTGHTHFPPPWGVFTALTGCQRFYLGGFHQPKAGVKTHWKKVALTYLQTLNLPSGSFSLPDRCLRHLHTFDVLYTQHTHTSTHTQLDRIYTGTCWLDFWQQGISPPCSFLPFSFQPRSPSFLYRRGNRVPFST